MTDPTPYTDDDVRHLVALIDEGQYHDSAIHPGSMARRLLAAGVTLPPEPDTPAEPQERYWVDQLEDWEVRGTGGERIHCYLSNGITLAPYAPLAEQVASLFNLDARYEDGIEAEIERLRDKASARAVKAAELALEDARAELIREREDQGLERDLFAARVKELETELAVLKEEGCLPQAEVDRIHEAELRSYGFRPTEPVPQDDGPAEPLFTGKVRGRRSLMGMKHLDWVQIAPAYREDFPFDRLDIDDLVDVYPHGQRPAEGDGQ